MIFKTSHRKTQWKVLPVLLLLWGCTNKHDVSNEKDTQSITAVSAARAKAFNDGDAEGIAIHFTDDALLMAPGKPAAQGREAVKAYYQLIFDE
ncbi:YybH family protein [Foetidibacter luteolus]|uniref:YybH family protein n=1 Tax=Foetidibacter luteolus TaxID=2608880 RepID=UPI001A98A20A|nr:SgcJ/EcaC family oxidoreductase [Foetidibacter luteolus]